IIKLLKYTRRTVYDITKIWEESGSPRGRSTSPGVTGICTPHICGWSQEVHKANPRTPVYPRQEAWGPPVVVP
ncbi:Hypothetical protein FKW44_023239, partial [Caligus rogercresseyi]